MPVREQGQFHEHGRVSSAAFQEKNYTPLRLSRLLRKSSLVLIIGAGTSSYKNEKALLEPKSRAKLLYERFPKLGRVFNSKWRRFKLRCWIYLILIKFKHYSKLVIRPNRI